MEAAGKFWIFSKTVFHSVWKTLLKTQKSLKTLNFYLLKNRLGFQPTPFFTFLETISFDSFRHKKIGKNLYKIHRLLHRKSTGSDFPRKNPQTFLFHRRSFQIFPQRKIRRWVLHKRRKFSKAFREELFTKEKMKNPRPPLVFRVFPIFRQALKPLLLKFFFSYSLKSAKREMESSPNVEIPKGKVKFLRKGFGDESPTILFDTFSYR